MCYKCNTIYFFLCYTFWPCVTNVTHIFRGLCCTCNTLFKACVALVLQKNSCNDQKEQENAQSKDQQSQLITIKQNFLTTVARAPIQKIY